MIVVQRQRTLDRHWAIYNDNGLLAGGFASRGEAEDAARVYQPGVKHYHVRLLGKLYHIYYGDDAVNTEPFVSLEAAAGYCEERNKTR
jgi:hypothetical protein